ncbi:cell growth regulator with RING finger domain protein 1-like [Ptychodera flava]|uniref:cell growth regulator with RING finger domain protein 1-like n=1 Tax=Ptychodera flava TaxID=63121 RepID=UPI00396A89A7
MGSSFNSGGSVHKTNMASDIAELSELSSILSILTVILCFSAMAVFIIRWGINPLPHISVSCPTENHVPATAMIGMRNPFTLEILDPDTSTLNSGVIVRVSAEEPFILYAYWGLDINSLHYLFRRSNTTFEEDSEETHFLQEDYLSKSDSFHFDICKDKEVKLEPDMESNGQDMDLGRLPRTKYPLVVVMSRTEPWTAHANEDCSKIVSMVNAIHLPDTSYSIKSHIILQFVLTNTGNYCNLQKFYMSTEQTENESREEAGNRDCCTEHDSESSVYEVKDCTVCQNAEISRVILPCRHACVCNQCFPMLNKCPMCRTPIESFFYIHENQTVESLYEVEEDEANMSGWIAKLENVCDRLNRLFGLEN